MYLLIKSFTMEAKFLLHYSVHYKWQYRPRRLFTSKRIWGFKY